ncbi:MAG: peptide MFS transporter [Bacteroidetes bacterium]|nr:peptide MFS transporter [Bacteroidota bacterium]MBS1933164.1 peptide MFS transporter [Bacteroidota bacterium]
MNALPEKKGHPRGLYVLFFTEMWERFGYYLMIGIFFLYLHDTVGHGGRGLDTAPAVSIVGTYVALIYLSPFIGGLIADRYLGYTKSIFIGGSLLSLGYFLLAFNGSDAVMYSGLFFAITGNGFFKPNISTLLGNIYNRPDLKPKKDIAYNIFYMGINIGAFICNFVAAYLHNKFQDNNGWGIAFSAAGFGMVISVIWFAFGLKHVKHADVIKPVQEGDMPISKIFTTVFLPAIAAGLIGWFIPGNILGSDSNDAFIFACIPIIIFYFSLLFRAKGFERKRISTLLILFGVSIIFWNIYNQNATALTIWAQTYTDREAPKAIQPALKPFGFLESVNTKPTEIPVVDEQFRAQTDAHGKVLTKQGTDLYFQNLQKDKYPPPGEDLKLFSTEIYQSINPFWIIVLTPLVVAFFGWRTSRNKTLSTPSKFAWGTLIAGLSSVVMVIACLITNIYFNKVSSWWIISSYGVFTISELFVSPVGLSLTSKVAPRRLTALMMGGWFIVTSLGGKISGILAGFWDKFDNKAVFFAISAIAAIIACFLLLPLTKKLNVIVEEAAASDD